jgi:hypothetical protein
MPTQRYALESGGPERLEVSWKGVYKNFTIKLDDKVIGSLSGQKELKAGQDFTLPDGSVLHAQLIQKLSGAELQILRNGEPLPGSAADPEQRLKVAYGIVFFLAGLNIVLGLIATLFQIEFLQAAGISIGSVVFGLIFLALGFLVKRGSAIALLIAIVLFALDGVLGLVFAIMGGFNPSIAGIVARIILIIPMVQGVGAIRALKQQPARGS